MICPLLMQARASIPELVYNGDVYDSGPVAAATTGGPLYPDPAAASRIACIGSRCAAWCPSAEKPAQGRCGMSSSPSQRFPDPAEVPHA